MPEPDLRAEPSESDKLAARVELIENAGLWRSREDFGDDTEKEAALARFHAQAREAGRREATQAAAQYLHAKGRWHLPATESWARLHEAAEEIERGDHLRRGE